METDNATTSKATNKAAKRAKNSSQKQILETKATKSSPSKDNTMKAQQLGISNEQRQSMIEVSAYFLAEKRGFIGGDPAQDWLMAEAEVDAFINHTPSNKTAA